MLDDGGSLDNTSQSYWLGQARRCASATRRRRCSRLFVDGSRRRTRNSMLPHRGCGHFLDGRSSVLRAGISLGPRRAGLGGNFGRARPCSTITDAASTDRSGLGLGGSARFRPDPTLTLSASLDSGLSPSATVAGDVDLDTALSGIAALSGQSVADAAGDGRLGPDGYARQRRRGDELWRGRRRRLSEHAASHLERRLWFRAFRPGGRAQHRQPAADRRRDAAALSLSRGRACAVQRGTGPTGPAGPARRRRWRARKPTLPPQSNDAALVFDAGEGLLASSGAASHR